MRTKRSLHPLSVRKLLSGEKSGTDGGRTEGGASVASSLEREVVSSLRPRNYWTVNCAGREKTAAMRNDDDVTSSTAFRHWGDGSAG